MHPLAAAEAPIRAADTSYMDEGGFTLENGRARTRSSTATPEPALEVKGDDADPDGVGAPSKNAPRSSRWASVVLSLFLGIVTFAAVLIATRMTAREALVLGLWGPPPDLLSSGEKPFVSESDSTCAHLGIIEAGSATADSCAPSNSRRPSKRWVRAIFRRFRKLISPGWRWWIERLQKREEKVTQRREKKERAVTRRHSSSSALLMSRFPTAYTLQPVRVSAVEAQWISEFVDLVRRSYENDPPELVLSSNQHHPGLFGNKRVGVDNDWRSAASSPRMAWGGGGVGDEAWDPARLSWWDTANVAARRRVPAKHLEGHDDDDDEWLLDRLDGGHVLHSYLKIMRTVHEHHHHPHKKAAESEFRLAHVYFPLKKCSKGCPASESIRHTLAWRASYLPWRVDGRVLRENDRGWLYARGWSSYPSDSEEPSSGGGPKSRHTTRRTNRGGARRHRHAVLWARPGIHRAVDGDAWMRTVLNGADRAVAQSLHASSGELGKFNVVIDVAGFEWGRTLPSLSTLQQVVSALQDHFPNRLGAVALLNLSRAAELVVNVIKPWLTKEVREKIHVMALHDLALLVEPESIPVWLGGPDPYEFSVDNYYPERLRV